MKQAARLPKWRLRFSKKGFYDARMMMKLRLPNDLAAYHAIMRDQATQIARLKKERDAALQFAFPVLARRL